VELRRQRTVVTSKLSDKRSRAAKDAGYLVAKAGTYSYNPNPKKK
jgi:hypothetical protein